MSSIRKFAFDWNFCTVLQFGNPVSAVEYRIIASLLTVWADLSPGNQNLILSYQLFIKPVTAVPCFV